MAQIALPRQQVTQTPQHPSGVGSPLYQRRRPSNIGPIELIPNPDFSFPQRGPDSETVQSSDAVSSSTARPMSLAAYPTGRRGSAHALRQKSISALPDFSFNPAAPTMPTTNVTTPPHSPLTTPTTPSRPIGHRRGGSEFIGGDGRTGAQNLLSSSPTKGDGVLPPPNAAFRPGPPAGRRGHAHRRSGAISSHDLSSIMRPADSAGAPRAGSAPVTPLEGDMFAFGHSVNKSISQPTLRDSSFHSDDSDSSPRRPPSRARVGFSDRVEYIRPLSTISSETETSMSTFRGHSTTNSLSSVISLGTASPPSTRMSRPSLPTTAETETRPSTAGAVLDNIRFGEELVTRKRPMSAVSPASPTVASPTSSRSSTKRRSFFRIEARRSEHSLAMLPASVSDPALTVPHDAPSESPLSSPKEEEMVSEPEKCKSRKMGRKPRKVKSWANSIISRKGKHANKHKHRAPTPPSEVPHDPEDTDGSDDVDFEANFDVDNTVTIVSPTDDEIPARKADKDIASWKPREFKRVDSDGVSAVIDLDAALGPFNTPQGSSPRTQQRGFASHRRAMHSSGSVLQNHRRTESAPELVPFEFRASAATAPSTMADVFEEDEPEDDNVPLTNTVGSPASIAEESDEYFEEPKIQVVEAEHTQTGPVINWNFNDGLGIKRGDKSRNSEASEPLSPHAIPQPLSIVLPKNSSNHSLQTDPIDVVEDHEEPRTSSLTHSSDSTVTPTLSANDSKDIRPMNVSIPLPQQSLMTPDTITSSFSSPDFQSSSDFRSSQASFETPRLGTASSSLTDYRAMPSPHFGEPGPELRISVDDVPSLTSSRSTMTSAMQSVLPIPPPRRQGDRSSSLSSAPSEIESGRQKRASMVSFSRLMTTSSSFIERSSLSREFRPQSSGEPSKEPKKKHKRLSKLISFWKPKESSRE